MKALNGIEQSLLKTFIDVFNEMKKLYISFEARHTILRTSLTPVRDRLNILVKLFTKLNRLGL
jgi:hypothetical protein